LEAEGFVTVAGAVLDFHEFPDSRATRAPENVAVSMEKFFTYVQSEVAGMSQIDYICVEYSSIT
jgi:hypothetical protein